MKKVEAKRKTPLTGCQGGFQFNRLFDDLQPGSTGGIVGYDLHNVMADRKVQVLLLVAGHIGQGNHCFSGRIYNRYIGGVVASRPRKSHSSLRWIWVNIGNER